MIDWASAAGGSAQGIPSHLPEIEDALAGLPSDVDAARSQLECLLNERTADGEFLESLPPSVRAVVPALAQRALRHALVMARP